MEYCISQISAVISLQQLQVYNDKQLHFSLAGLFVMRVVVALLPDEDCVQICLACLQFRDWQLRGRLQNHRQPSQTIQAQLSSCPWHIHQHSMNQSKSQSRVHRLEIFTLQTMSHGRARKEELWTNHIMYHEHHHK